MCFHSEDKRPIRLWSYLNVSATMTTMIRNKHTGTELFFSTSVTLNLINVIYLCMYVCMYVCMYTCM